MMQAPILARPARALTAMGRRTNWRAESRTNWRAESGRFLLLRQQESATFGFTGSDLEPVDRSAKRLARLRGA